jgi:hypothetical protein
LRTGLLPAQPNNKQSLTINFKNFLSYRSSNSHSRLATKHEWSVKTNSSLAQGNRADLTYFASPGAKFTAIDLPILKHFLYNRNADGDHPYHSNDNGLSDRDPALCGMFGDLAHNASY